MPTARYPVPPLLGRAAPQRRRHAPRGPGARGSGPGPRPRVFDWLASLPPRAHLIPYGALLALGAFLFIPGVVPQGADCGGLLAQAPAAAREFFIRASAAAFGLMAALLLLSAVTASAQRRGRRPGTPTIAAASVLGALTLVTVIWPHAPVAAPVQFLMAIDVLALALSYGGALLVVLAVSLLAWRGLSGPSSLRASQIGAWVTLLVALPLVMAVTYLIVTPICWG